MGKINPQYRIESFHESTGWRVVPVWWGLQKSYAEGAFAMLKAMMGDKQYRLVRTRYGDDPIRSPGEVVDICKQGMMRASGGGDYP